jgi:hypothetical protein
MKAIVIVFMSARNQQLARPALNGFSDRPGEAETPKAETPQPSREQTNPPLWTWFIENPLRCDA